MAASLHKKLLRKLIEENNEDNLYAWHIVLPLPRMNLIYISISAYFTFSSVTPADCPFYLDPPFVVVVEQL